MISSGLNDWVLDAGPLYEAFLYRSDDPQAGPGVGEPAHRSLARR